jgi:hypothetical protein
MPQQPIRDILTLLTIILVSAIVVLAQTPSSTEGLTLNTSNNIALNPGDTWEGAQLIVSSKGKDFRKLFIVTADRPDHRQPCHVQSFTEDKLVCSRVIGGSRSYFPRQVAALIVPGDDELRRWVLLSLNGGLGVSIWATVVLAAACPGCAAATAFAAFVCFSFAGAIAYTDDVPDRLLYLAAGQELSRRLGYVQR